MLEELKEANSYISSKIDKYRSRSLLIREIEEDAEINNVPIISKEIREKIPHHQIDIVNPDETYTA